MFVYSTRLSVFKTTHQIDHVGNAICMTIVLCMAAELGLANFVMLSLESLIKIAKLALSIKHLIEPISLS